MALLPIISKIFERATANQWVDYLERNNVLDNIQHGFTQDKYVETAATESLETMIDSVGWGEKAARIFMDLHIRPLTVSTLINKSRN